MENRIEKKNLHQHLDILTQSELGLIEELLEFNEVQAFRYDGWKDENDYIFLQIPYTTSGDYVGSTVERANREAILEDHDDIFESRRYDYSTESLVLSFRDNEYTDDQVEIIKDILTGFENYPLYNDEKMSELEWGACFDENLDTWLCSDMETKLEEISGFEDLDLSHEHCRKLAFDFFEHQGYGPEYETGGSLYFDFDEFEKWLKPQIDGLKGEALNLLLTGEKWQGGIVEQLLEQSKESQEEKSLIEGFMLGRNCSETEARIELKLMGEWIA